jgi:hypothetical protein
MGTDRSNGDLRGLLIPDPRFSIDNLVSESDATVPSSYTQAGAHTGPAVPDQTTGLVLRTSGTQSDGGDLEVLTRRAGGVGGDGAALCWRDVAGGDGTDDYKGWDGYQVVTGWETLLWTDSAPGASPRPSIIRLLSGRLLAAYSVTALGVVRIKRYDPSDASWTAVNLGPQGAGSGYITPAVGLCQLPSGRVLAFCPAYDNEQMDAYYSDDDGTNWSEYGYRVLDSGIASGSTVTEVTVAYSEGEILLVVTYNDGSDDTAAPFVSYDLGTSFDRTMATDVELETSETPDSVDVLPVSGGGFVITYLDTTGGKVYARRLPQGRTAWDVADRVTISGVAKESAAGWLDEDGRMYVAHHGSNNYGITLYRSLDGGATWTATARSLGWHIHAGATFTNYLTGFACQSVGGRAALLTRWSAAAGNEDPYSVGVAWLGGYTNHTVPIARATSVSAAVTDLEYIYFGTESITVNGGGVYLPVEEPDQIDWTQAVSGTESLDLVSPGVAEITTSTGTHYYTRALAVNDTIMVDFGVGLDSGDGSLSSADVALRLRIADASTYQYTITIRLADTGWRLYDEEAASAVGSDVTADLTTRHHIRLVMRSGKIATWYSTAANHAHERVWTEGPGGSLADGGGTANGNSIVWGHIDSGSAVSRWHMVAYCCWCGPWAPENADQPPEGWTNPDDLHGRPYPGAGFPVLLTDGVSIEATSGPTALGETQRIAAAADYPVSAALPSSSPSPSREYRSSVDGADVRLVFDLEPEIGGADSLLETTTLAAFFVRSNIQTATIDGWNGAAWVTLMTADASVGFSGLPFVRKGRAIYPDVGSSPTADRWSFHMMHAGDTIKLVSGETTKYRRIATNTEGAWRSGTKLARLMLDPDSMDGTEPTSGTATIYRRNFGVLAYAGSTSYRYISLRIPAQTTPDGYYRVGIAAMGPVHLWGRQPGNGWSWELAANTELTTRDSGARTSRVRGAPRRAVELSWSQQATDTTRAWDSEPSPDYLTGITAGDPVASPADLAYAVMGHLERTEGAHAPVVLISQIPRGSVTSNYTLDPTWVYGRIVSESVSIDQVIGDEGSGAVFRVNQMRIEEEK